MPLKCFTAVILLVVFILGTVTYALDSSPAVHVINTHSMMRTKIAFGSCNKYYRSHKSDIFYDVANQIPDVWVWLGDIAYIDNMQNPWYSEPEYDMKRAAQKLNISKNDPGSQLVIVFAGTFNQPSEKYKFAIAYQKMLTQVNGEIGTWDDHDYGFNNADANFTLKHEMRQVWLDFFNEPKDSLRRTRSSGIYTSYYLGEAKRLKIILTDTRWNRHRYDILGEAQWKWLEDELADAQVELFIIGTGSQFMHDDRFIPENWDIQSKERLYSIINKTRASVVIISGDVHYAEIMQHPCSIKKVGYNLIEITSSGLSFDLDHHESGTFHFGETFVITPTYNEKKDRFFGKNYGLIDIKWDEIDVMSTVISLEIFTIHNQTPVLSKVIELRDLQRSEELYAESQSSGCIVDDVRPFIRWRSFVLNSMWEILQLVFWAYLAYTCYQGFKAKQK